MSLTNRIRYQYGIITVSVRHHYGSRTVLDGVVVGVGLFLGGWGGRSFGVGLDYFGLGWVREMFVMVLDGLFVFVVSFYRFVNVF